MNIKGTLAVFLVLISGLVWAEDYDPPATEEPQEQLSDSPPPDTYVATKEPFSPVKVKKSQGFSPVIIKKDTKKPITFADIAKRAKK